MYRLGCTTGQLAGLGSSGLGGCWFREFGSAWSEGETDVFTGLAGAYCSMYSVPLPERVFRIGLGIEAKDDICTYAELDDIARKYPPKPGDVPASWDGDEAACGGRKLPGLSPSGGSTPPSGGVSPSGGGGVESDGLPGWVLPVGGAAAGLLLLFLLKR